jgi:hypothetical protein
MKNKLENKASRKPQVADLRERKEHIMEQSYYVGECPVCKGYGRMEVIFNYANEDCSIMCDDCSLEFSSVVDYLKNKNGYRLYYEENEAAAARTATLEEIKDSEWYPYLK